MDGESQITFRKECSGDVIVSAAPEGLFIVSGFLTIGVPRAAALQYVLQWNESPNAGFFEDHGKVVLSHGSAKASFEPSEGMQIRDLIARVYGPI